MKVLVCGGRNYSDRTAVEAMLYGILYKYGSLTVIHGDAPGADTLAKETAIAMGVTQKPYPARWAEHGRRAGPIRNALMLRDNPDIGMVVAFPGGVGTADMVRKAKKAGIRVVLIGQH